MVEEIGVAPGGCKIIRIVAANQFDLEREMMAFTDRIVGTVQTDFSIERCVAVFDVAKVADR